MKMKVVNDRINDCYIKFCENNRMSSDTGITLSKFRSELIKEIKNLFNEGNISNTMMKDLINNFNK